MIQDRIDRAAEVLDDIPADGVILTRGDAIPLVPVRWLWQGWLAAGKMHLLAGAPGQGKTTIAMAFAATVSSGGVWPDKKRCAPGNVLVWTGEDDPGDTLNPRFVGMGGNLARIHYVTSIRVDGEEKTFAPARDLPGLLAAAQAIGDVRLIVVDPVVSAVVGDSHKSAEVRQSLQPLVDLAATLKAAAIGITHLSKGSAGKDPTERVLGSVAFSALARVVLLAAKIKVDGGADKRILIRSKSNIGPDDGGYQYFIEQVQVMDGIEASITTWGEPIEGTARELLAEAEAEPPTESTSDAAEMLRHELSADCWTPYDTAAAPLRKAGFTKKQIWAASNKLGVIRKKGAMQSGWYWRLPGGADPQLPTAEDSEDSEGSEDSSLRSTESSGTFRASITEDSRRLQPQNLESSESSGVLESSADADEVLL